ncbi:hypothetical protein BVI434_340020 [Burkholderia vietnamiensis]|nr:hypothetical protein BVI434_340020 [Burkholderia vietnamiensis]
MTRKNDGMKGSKKKSSRGQKNPLKQILMKCPRFDYF